MRRVVVLRPEPGASATVARARDRGFDAVAIPLFEVEPLEWQPPDPGAFDGLLFSSANAVRHAGPGLDGFRHLPVHAVGAATADAARDAGFEVANVGGRGVRSLLASLGSPRTLLHLCGEHRTATPDAGHAVTVVPVYRAAETEDVDVHAAEGGIVLVHSPRAGRRFAELAAAKEDIVIVAISAAAAEATGGGWQSVEVADAPSDEAMLALAARLCKTSDRT